MGLEEILQKVCEYNDVSIELVKSKSRRMHIVEVRQQYFYIARNIKKDIPIPFKQIGELVNCDHATVVHSCRKADDFIKFDRFFKNRLNKIYKAITGEYIDDKPTDSLRDTVDILKAQVADLIRQVNDLKLQLA